MPITIAPVSPQNITLNTAYSLPISITDDPDTVEVKGLLEGFYYSYADGTLTIAGESTRLINNAMWAITAKKGSDTATREVVYNVVPPAPIIATVPKQFISKGALYSLDIPIQNPGDVKVTGHIIGLKYDGTNPLNISGTVPLDAEFTVESGIFVIEAKNGGGMHTRNVEWEFARNLFGVDSSNDRVHVFSTHPPAGEPFNASRVFDLPSRLSSPTSAALDGNDLYIHNLAQNEVFVIPADTPHMGTATESRKFGVNAPGSSPGGLTVDDTYVYLFGRNGSVYVFDKLTPSTQGADKVEPTRSFSTVPTFSSGGLTHDGTYLYILYRDGNDFQLYIAVVPKNTTSSTATVDRRFQLPLVSGFPDALVIDGDDIYCVTDSEIMYVFSKDTADGTQAAVSRSFNLPSGVDNVRGLGIA